MTLLNLFMRKKYFIVQRCKGFLADGLMIFLTLFLINAQYNYNKNMELTTNNFANIQSITSLRVYIINLLIFQLCYNRRYNNV